MHIDLRSSKPERLTADVAIIGSGAAGQTVARALAQAGLSTLVLESGGLDYERETAEFNQGRNVGQSYYELDHSRLRLFGGTTAIWGGRCAELTEIDFAPRQWVPWSGWPVDQQTLRPYYDRAWELVGIDANGDRLKRPPALQPLDGSDLQVLHWRIDRKADRFQARWGNGLLHDNSSTVVTHATVREIVPSANGEAVDHLIVCGPGGERLIADASHYVLAAGAIENARLLLASNSVQPSGLGNQNDLVGRFFMEHPHGRGGRIVKSSVWPFVKAFQKRSHGDHDIAWLFALSANAQERMGVLNSAFTLALRPPPGGSRSIVTLAYSAARHSIAPTQAGRTLWQSYKRLERMARGTVTPVGRWARHRFGKDELTIVLRAEQSPNPDSRVRLSVDKVDRLGMPQVELDWRLQRLDRESAAGLVAAFTEEMQRRELGTVEPSQWLADGGENWVSDPTVSAHSFGGYHHIGTTRMADDPKKGVTDQWGRVHGIGNLFVAGSSLFPTGGWANPTLTILALALRTADRIAEVSKSGR